ncbi:DUF721 domain-containing protein [Aestuariivirga litoralis]|uniref:DUF721 domain-containing protein n=1 Tax=Aestuariivirga litoralis TaxID=2650924 RepID=UPI0018C5EC3A|nr:DciA family protein [Aestuariivirga litoralis]MBG1233336.1 DUF721 domain-containing protein [Aestuariivirga litoralis]
MESLNKHFAAIAKETFQRHGFASDQIAAQWPAIVGEAIAAAARPERIKWPRTAEAQKQKLGGTLVLRAPAGLALEVHYEIPRIIERVNQFLGYGAIAAIKVVQSSELPPMPKLPAKPKTQAAVTAWNSAIDGFEDDDLKSALARLALEVSPAGPTTSAFSTGGNSGFETQPTSSRKLP